MKNNLVLGPVLFALGFVIALILRLGGFASIDLLDVPVMIGAVFSAGLLLVAFADYSRKPRFRMHSERRRTPAAAVPATRGLPDWTYTPFAT